VLVQGLAPHDLDAFLLQRDRWARGNLWVFRTPQNPVLGHGLTLNQRISYTGSLLSYGSGLYRLVLLSCLVATLVAGRLPLTSPPGPLFAIWLPWMLLTTIGSLAIGRGAIGLMDAWRYGLLTMGIFTRAVLATIFSRRQGRFKVTPKGAFDEGGWRVVRSLGLLATLTALLATGVVVRIGAMFGLVPVPRMPLWAEALTVVLACWTIAVIWSAVRPVVKRRQLRASWRFPVNLAATHGGDIVQLVDLSPDGAGLLVPEPVERGTRYDLQVRLPGPGGQERTVTLDLEVRSCRPYGDTWRAGGLLLDVSPRDHALLVHYCFVVAMTEGLGTPPASTHEDAAAASGDLHVGHAAV
jgi:cellulose synthase (UDP-forming)